MCSWDSRARTIALVFFVSNCVKQNIHHPVLYFATGKVAPSLNLIVVVHWLGSVVASLLTIWDTCL